MAVSRLRRRCKQGRRAFTDTFAGIAPASIAGFIGMQLVGAVAGLALVALVSLPGREAAE
ncbi:hypothetical protein ABB07_16525 [Streptomyces incarnatus]|uniref:Uncharacterized protein n=1 Tax=Streptomyces incarnatus TaxID=665007 RepID=A0ABN4GIG0_9ACTN|nr:hypothetical protein ABB07_16525 [Streptomyces incarnatus]